MMKKQPTYFQLCDLIRYLSYQSDYEKLPITQETRETIEFALEYYKNNVDQKDAA